MFDSPKISPKDEEEMEDFHDYEDEEHTDGQLDEYDDSEDDDEDEDEEPKGPSTRKSRANVKEEHTSVESDGAPRNGFFHYAGDSYLFFIFEMTPITITRSRPQSKKEARRRRGPPLQLPR